MISQLTSPFIVHTLITKVSFIEMLKYRNLQGTAAEWNRMLMFTSILCIVSGVQFLIWGSGYHKEEKGQRKCFYRGDTRICKERRGESSSGRGGRRRSAEEEDPLDCRRRGEGNIPEAVEKQLQS